MGNAPRKVLHGSGHHEPFFIGIAKRRVWQNLKLGDEPFGASTLHSLLEAPYRKNNWCTQKRTTPNIRVGLPVFLNNQPKLLTLTKNLK